MEISGTWLEALPGDACGPDLEYDPAFLELQQTAAGKPETQFGPAEPPVWPLVREQAEALLAQTRDLRVALFWARAAVNLEGIEGLGPGLSLLHGLMDRYWEDLHPRPDPDDGDTFARVSVLAGLNTAAGLLGDFRQAPLLRERRLGGLRMRDVEVALGKLEVRSGDTSYNTGQISGLIADHPDLLERIASNCQAATEALQMLRRLMNDRFGIDTVEVKALAAMLSGLKSLIPDSAATSGVESSVEDQTPEIAAMDTAPAPPVTQVARRTSGGSGAIESRQDVLRMINLICDYLERTEPANPAQLLLRRAERMIDKNFIQLVRDLAPDAVNEVARILGVSPEAFSEGVDS